MRARNLFSPISRKVLFDQQGYRDFAPTALGFVSKFTTWNIRFTEVIQSLRLQTGQSTVDSRLIHSGQGKVLQCPGSDLPEEGTRFRTG